MERHAQQCVEEEALPLDHRVLERAEARQPVGDEAVERALRLRRRDGELAWTVLAEEVEPERVDVRAHLLVDGVLGRAVRIGGVKVLRRRLAVVLVEVPAPALGLAVGTHEHLEAAALLAVEVLHHQPLAIARPLRERLRRGEELVRVDLAHAEALDPPPRSRRVRRRADDLTTGYAGGAHRVQQAGLERRGPAPLDDLDLSGLAQLVGEVTHAAEHEVHPAAVGAQAPHACGRLDEENARGAVERRVVAHELVAEDQCGVAHRQGVRASAQSSAPASIRRCSGLRHVCGRWPRAL